MTRPHTADPSTNSFKTELKYSIPSQNAKENTIQGSSESQPTTEKSTPSVAEKSLKRMFDNPPSFKNIPSCFGGWTVYFIVSIFSVALFVGILLLVRPVFILEPEDHDPESLTFPNISPVRVAVSALIWVLVSTGIFIGVSSTIGSKSKKYVRGKGRRTRGPVQ